jgi:uncharacterized protein
MFLAYLLALTIHLHFPENESLKGKRNELLRVKAAVGRKFGASIAEVDHHDLWQRSTLAASLVGNSPRDLERTADRIEGFLMHRLPDGVRVDRRLVSFEDLD